MNSFETFIERVQETTQYAEEALRFEISEAVYTAMESQNVSRAELARRLETSRANVTQMLQGNNNFEVSTLARISRALGLKCCVSFTALLSTPETPKEKEDV